MIFFEGLWYNVVHYGLWFQLGETFQTKLNVFIVRRSNKRTFTFQLNQLDDGLKLLFPKTSNMSYVFTMVVYLLYQYCCKMTINLSVCVIEFSRCNVNKWLYTRIHGIINYIIHII